MLHALLDRSSSQSWHDLDMVLSLRRMILYPHGLVLGSNSNYAMNFPAPFFQHLTPESFLLPNS
jgi:hypothetical protein